MKGPTNMKFTVIWMMRGNPCVTKITLESGADAAALEHDGWVARALIAYWAEMGETWALEKALAQIEDRGHGLAAVVAGHEVIWESGVKPTKPLTVAERIDPTSPHHDAAFSALRIKAYGGRPEAKLIASCRHRRRMISTNLTRRSAWASYEIPRLTSVR